VPAIAEREAAPTGGSHVRDVVLGAPSLPAALVSATATSHHYPVGDAAGRAVEVAMTIACRHHCTAADPEKIAEFLGTLAHASEMNLLKVQLSTPREIAYSCGAGVQACYYPLGNRMVINGNDTVADDGATRAFVIAHEYGHHLANHRPAPPPGSPAISWGTPRWASHERVCRIKGRGLYFRNPGEAFAEAFAFSRFPDAAVRWAWSWSLKPDAGAFAAIGDDVLAPWRRMGRSRFSRRLPGGGSTTHKFSARFDGMVTVRLRSSSPRRFKLRLFDSHGQLLADGVGRRRGAALRYSLCGQRKLRLVVRRRGPAAGRYRLSIQAP